MDKLLFSTEKEGDKVVGKLILIGDVSGVGEDYFDSISANKIIEKLSSEKIDSLKYILSSFGGNLSSALIIHDYIKGLSIPTQSTVFGMTASAGTIIAAAANVKRGSRTSMYLPHNSRKDASGTAEDLIKAAESLKVADGLIESVYMSAGFKGDKSELQEILKQDSWRDVKWAKKYGFIDEIIDADEILNKTTNIISNTMEIKDEKNFLDKLVEAIKLAFAKEEKTEKKEEVVVPQVDQVAIAKADFENKQNEIKSAFEKELSKKDAEIKASAEKILELEAENARIKAGETTLPKSGDPSLDKEKENKFVNSLYYEWKKSKGII